MITAQIERIGATTKDYGSMPADLEACYERMVEILMLEDIIGSEWLGEGIFLNLIRAFNVQVR